MSVPPPRRVPLDPHPEYRVRFAPELVHELYQLEEMDEVVQELESVLALRFADVGGRRIEMIEGSRGVSLYKYRPHTVNDMRFIFGVLEEIKVRVVLTSFPRKHNYRKQDVRTAADRLRRVQGPKDP